MLNSESQKPAAYKFISLEKSGIRLYFTKEENARYYFARVKKLGKYEEWVFNKDNNQENILIVTCYNKFVI